MKHYSQAAMEGAMERQGVIISAIANDITWWQAARFWGVVLVTRRGSGPCRAHHRVGGLAPEGARGRRKMPVSSERERSGSAAGLSVGR